MIAAGPANDLLPPAPAHLELDLRPLLAGSRWFRFVRAAHLNPLGVGAGPSRFSDPDLDAGRPPRFRPLYLGASFGVCFLETILRDAANGRPGDWPLAISELGLWTCASITVTAPMLTADLRGDAAIRARVPSDALRAADQRLGRTWSAAIWAHPDAPHGIAYNSRLNGEECLAVYVDDARAAAASLACTGRAPLLDMVDELAATLDRFKVALVP